MLNFRITDLPDGGSVRAFSTENLQLKRGAKCAEASCEAEFSGTGVSGTGSITASVQGITVTVTNTGTEDLTNIVVYCRSSFDKAYFGGMTYKYTIENLPAGESATVEALDCILGSAEVVRIAINES